MKKHFLFGILFIVVGYLLGTFIFSTKLSFNTGNTYYFIKDNNTYLGITKDLETVEVIQDIYSEKGIDSSVIKRNIVSKDLENNIMKFDTLIKNSKSIEDILIIEKVALTYYYQKTSSKN
ncbi:MAG: hypothetical protein IKE63_03810 [Bacilli bacterium]|nr:hypothetical protein [Bacilli bacterium]